MKKTIYLYKSGELHRKDSSLCLLNKNGDVTYIPIEQIDAVLCFGDITLNKRVLGLLNTYCVSAQFYNYYGQYIGRFTPKEYVSGKDMICQIDSFRNDKMRLSIAYAITETELHNILSLLKYYNKKDIDLINMIHAISDILSELEECNSVDQLLLKEAQSKKSYYAGIDKILENTNYHFVKRSIQPPGNEVNALMSYGYALLYANFLAEIDKSPLMANISYVHSIAKTTDSLQYDLADILKPVIVDRMVLRMIRKNQLKNSYFNKTNNSCYLSKEGVAFYLSEYENQLAHSIYIDNRYYSYKNIITKEVYNLYNYITGKKKFYKPYRMEW